MDYLQSIEADLISAAALGERALHAEMFRKVASLSLDEDDIQAVYDALASAQEEAHTKAAAGIGQAASAVLNPKVLQGLALASLAAGPAMAGISWLKNTRAKEDGWRELSATHPDLVGKDPNRARAIYSLLHSTSPMISQNPVIAGDIMNQMMSLPQIDLNTVKTLTSIKKQDDGFDLSSALDGVSKVPSQMKGFQALAAGDPKAPDVKTSAWWVPARHIAEDGTPCLIDWSTPAMKRAGIVDAFTGSGTPIEQADNAMASQQMSQGAPLMPLDSVVRELISKEMELAQREDVIMQQEMQLQQAFQQLQQMSQGYEDEFGVDAATGGPMYDDPAVAAGAPPAGAGGFPPEMGMAEPPPGYGDLPPEELPPEELPPAELPPEELPPAELPPEELPPAELPPEELPPEELPPEELPPEGLPPEELPPEGLPPEELPPEGLPPEELPPEELPPEELPPEELPPEMPPEELPPEELPPEMPLEELPPEELPPEELPPEGFMPYGAGPEGQEMTFMVPLPSLQISVKAAGVPEPDLVQQALDESNTTMQDLFTLP